MRESLRLGKRDAPEGLPGSGTEIEGGFFLGAIHFLQAGEKFGGGDGDQRGAVPEKDGKQAELHADAIDEHEEREAGDDAGKNERKEDEAAEERFTGETVRDRGRERLAGRA